MNSRSNVSSGVATITPIQRIHMPALRLAAVALACASASTLRAQSALSAPTGRWAANITPLNELRGSAELTVAPRGPRESRLRLTVRLVPINRQLAWDVVAGRCGEEGRPIAAAAAFRQILSRNDGSGDATATLPAVEAGKAYYVRVFAPGTVPSDRTGYGCANLSEVP
jgi:hypothetical protein